MKAFVELGFTLDEIRFLYPESLDTAYESGREYWVDTITESISTDMKYFLQDTFGPNLSWYEWSAYGYQLSCQGSFSLDYAPFLSDGFSGSGLVPPPIPNGWENVTVHLADKDFGQCYVSGDFDGQWDYLITDGLKNWWDDCMSNYVMPFFRELVDYTESDDFIESMCDANEILFDRTGRIV